MPSASCGRSVLYSCRHTSKAVWSRPMRPACNSRRMSRCMRSCAPLSCGQPGRLRSRLIPRASHHTDNRVSPNSPWALAKGEPLSLRIAAGTPCAANNRSKQGRTDSVLPSARVLISKSIRLNSSRTVNGSTRSPSRSFHHPLKSTVQTSLAFSALTPLARRPASLARRTRRGTVKPARASTRLKLLSLGISGPCRRA